MKINKVLFLVSVGFASFIAFSAYNEVGKKGAFNKKNFAPAIKPDTIVIDLSSGVSLRKSKGTFKYKDDDSAGAQQSWKTQGSVPTSHTSFDTVNNITLSGKGGGKTVSDSFWVNTTGIKGRHNTRLKQKFFAYSVKSSGHHFPSFGIFSAEIEDGEMKFNFAINKANQGGVLQGMEDYDAIKETMQEEKKRQFVEPVSGGVGVNSTTYGYSGTAKCSAKKTKAKAILE